MFSKHLYKFSKFILSKPDYNKLMRFTINDVCNWLAENKFGEFVKMFREHGIDGNRFVTLEDLDLTKMRCPMNKRRDLLRLVKDLPKPAEPRVKGMVQPVIPATPTRDYNNRPPAPAPVPVPAPIQTHQNGVMAHDDDDDDSGPEDDYEWDASDFTDESSEEEEDYENTTVDPLQKQPDQEDDDNSDTYEEPETQSSQPPPSVPRRAAAPPGSSQSPQHGVPVNRRAVPQIPQIPQMSTMDQSVYEETNTNDESEQQVYDETIEQAVYEDPDSEPVKRTERKPIPEPVSKANILRKVPMRSTSEPDSPAPPPPRTQKGNKKAEEQSAPAPPPPRGGRKQSKPPSPEPEEQDFYMEPDPIPVLPSTVRRSALPSLPKEAFHTPVPEPDEQDDVYEDPDEPVKPTLPPTPKVSHPPSKVFQPTKKPPPPKQEIFDQDDVYEEPDEPVKPTRGKVTLPPTPKVSHPPSKVSQPTKKPPPPKQKQELDYAVTDNMPQDDYMVMQPSPEEVRPAGKRGQRSLPNIPVNDNDKQVPVTAPNKSTDSARKHKNRPLPQPVDKPVGLDDQPWYHGDIQRQVAENKLVECGTNGCYLVRRSKNGGETKPYTLAIIYSGQVFNLNIRKKTNSKYALGMAKTDEQEFSDLLELVTFFNTHRLILAKGQTRLKKPCLK